MKHEILSVEKPLNAEEVISLKFHCHHRYSSSGSTRDWEDITMENAISTLIYTVRQIQLACVSACILSSEAILTSFIFSILMVFCYVASASILPDWSKSVAILSIFVADFVHTLPAEVGPFTLQIPKFSIQI